MKSAVKPVPARPAAASVPGDRPRAELIADAIRDSILAGVLAAGEPLRQDAIAADFGVSHIPVREALRHLAAEGLVNIRRNHGATVSRLSPEEATELLEIRAALETQAVRWAIPAADEALFAQAARLLEQAEAVQDPGEWLGLNWRFHKLLYERAGRPRLLDMIEGLDRRIDRFVRLLIIRSDYRFQAQAEHRAILAAYGVRNAAAVCSLIEQHLAETARLLAQYLGETAARPPQA